MKWTMQNSKTQRIGDFENLQCADTSFKNQSISYVMRIKKVITRCAKGKGEENNTFYSFSRYEKCAKQVPS